MRALVAYESMFGNTRRVAEAVAQGLRDTAHADVDVVPVHDLGAQDLRDAALLVLGAPTHAWSLSRPRTRESAAGTARSATGRLELEPGATGPGLREWLAGKQLPPCPIAAFDTHLHAPLGLSGSATRAIVRGLRRAGAGRGITTASFIVTKQNELRPGELERARAWGASLAPLLSGQAA